MNNSIKKDLTSNWFKLLQNAICNDILELENNKIKFESTSWKRNSKKDEGGGEYRILKNGAMNIFIYLTEKKLEELGEFFLITKMIISKKILNL